MDMSKNDVRKLSRPAGIVNVAPALLCREDAAAFLAISESTLDSLVAAGDAPKPRKVSARRAAWLVEELTAWAKARPVSDFLPPVNCGYGRGGKPVR
jgi:predicted DNA-binding transcriptional regulator AlpA